MFFNIMEEYLNKLREFFNNRGLSQAEIARRLGITKGAVNQYFTGKSLFGKKQAERWSQEFGISKNFLLTREGSPNPQQDQGDAIESVTDTIRILTNLIEEKNKLIEFLREENERLRKENKKK